MPRGRKPEGDHALSNAERQARYRAHRLTKPSPVVTRTRRSTDRRSRPQRWRDAVAELLALQAEYARWLTGLPTACATPPLPRLSRPSLISSSLPSPTSSRPAATVVTDRLPQADHDPLDLGLVM